MVDSVNNDRQPRLRHGNSRWYQKNKKSPLVIQRCFNCASPKKLARNCPKLLNLARSAVWKLEYLNKRERSNAVQMVRADIYYLCDEKEGLSVKMSIFISLLEVERELRRDLNDGPAPNTVSDVVLLESTINIDKPKDETFREHELNLECSGPW